MTVASTPFGVTWPDAGTFRELARDRRVIPVVRRLLADAETPLGVYRKLAQDRPGTFLLESAEHGGVWSRYSIIGARCAATLTERNGEACWIGEPPVGVPTSGDPTKALRDTVNALRTEAVGGLPPLTGGMVGAMTYDVVRRWERLPDNTVDDLRLPELTMMLATDLAVLDHADGSLLLVANAVNYDHTNERVDEAWSDAVARLDRMSAELAASADSTVAVMDLAAPRSRPQLPPGGYEANVERAKEAIRAGDVFQVVPSQRYEIDCPVDALDVYRVLRASNPSPYMYLLRLPLPDGGTYDVVGSSPEALVKVEGRRVMTHPIAGTRPRGSTPEQDAENDERVQVIRHGGEDRTLRPMDFELTKEQRLIQQTVRSFVDERVLPVAVRNDIDHRVDRDLIDGMAELGILGIDTSSQCGKSHRAIHRAGVEVSQAEGLGQCPRHRGFARAGGPVDRDHLHEARTLLGGVPAVGQRGQDLPERWKGLGHAARIGDVDARDEQAQERKAHRHAMVMVSANRGW